ncbi:AI-2 transport protein TqsA [Massilia sp. Bi118]|uniref:AI-2E family transporter n=1 Tax=Massilia sp. Bi118 TaxID=2822346 RepID=UPI001E0B173D|nr:AI-2E family transporter [Massilia sp. Bi118]CAH0190216.1 AI-2 transport protein TqsA [Massilia sp. Bi118]
MRDLSLFKHLNAGSLVTVTCGLGLLYFGRDVLEPIALASILSLVIAPLIRSMRRAGLAQMPATMLSVLLATTCLVGVGIVLAFQLVAVTRDLPKYRAAMRTKVAAVRELAERPFERIEAELSAVAPSSGTTATGRRGMTTITISPTQPIPVEIRAPRLTTTGALTRLFSLAWGPIGEAGLVLVLLIFMSLEHESLRDRLIRLGGQTEVSRTIQALADAAQGVSRFFFSQFVVNVTFGLLIGVVLWAADVPHAALWGALSGLLRFVPYLGIMAAGAVIAMFVAAIDPGWTLALSCMVLFIALELLVANIVEPKVYGHSSGLSPLAVIISALFWGAMWGPVGLLLSTPLTLCLVVAGRHVRTLEPVTILLGDAPAVSGAQRFYQRILAGDIAAIIHDAQDFLERSSFARYCDHILLPGIVLAANDTRSGKMEKPQEDRIRTAIADVAATLTPESGGPPKSRRRNMSLLDANIGAHLRQMREARLGRWQGALDVPAHSVVLCVGLATMRDDMLSELLVRALREDQVDARSFSIIGDSENPGPDKADLVSTVFINYPTEAMLDQWLTAVANLRAGLPEAMLVTIRLPLIDPVPSASLVEKQVDMVLRSFEEALAFVAPEHAPRQ